MHSAWDGLQLLCNTFSENCKYAIAVNTPSGICYSQGSPTKSAGNLFSPNYREAEETDIYTPKELTIKYYHNIGIAEEKPERVSEDVWLNETTGAANCGISTGNTPEIIRMDFEASKARYTTISYNYNNLIDGGSTSQLLLELELSWDKTAWEIRDQLMAKSPYLSPDVIMEVAEKNILPQAMLLEICLANPDATRKGDMLYILRYKIPNPMPEYMCDLIVASWEGETFRTHLEASLANAALDLEYTARQLIALYLEDSTMNNCNDSIIYVLERLPNIEAVYEIADIYAGMYQFETALGKIAELEEDKLSEKEREEMYAMLIWHEFLRNYSEKEDREELLSPQEIDFLQELSQTNTKASDRVKSLLYYYSGCSYNYHVEPEFPEFIKPKALKNTRNPQDVLNELYNKVSVHPNPAETYTTFSYDFQAEIKNSLLQIYDNGGKLILSTPLSGNVGHYLWDTRGTSSGTYTYIIISNERKVNSGKVVVKK